MRGPPVEPDAGLEEVQRVHPVPGRGPEGPLGAQRSEGFGAGGDICIKLRLLTWGRAMTPRKTANATKMALLEHVDLLADCTKKELAEIASISTECDASAGQVLAQEGQLGAEFFIIVNGEATASRNGVVLAKLASTNFFGELALLDGGPRTATVVADTDLQLLVLSRREFNQLCRTYPSVSYRMLKGLGARLRTADEMIGQSSHPDTTAHITV